MDDDFNEFAPLLHPLSQEPFLIDGKQAKPDLMDLEDISPGRKLRSLVNSSKFLLRLFSPDFETRLSGVKKCGDPPFLPDAFSTLEGFAVDPNQNKKIRFTAQESIELMILGGAMENKTSTQDRLSALTKLGELNSLRALPNDSFETEVTNVLKNCTSVKLKEFKKSISSVRKKIESTKKGGVVRKSFPGIFLWQRSHSDGTWISNYFWTNGCNQHGSWRTHDDWCLHHL